MISEGRPCATSNARAFRDLWRLVGHKTESIYRRYEIVAKQDLVDGIKRLADYRATVDKTPAEKKVVEMKEAMK